MPQQAAGATADPTGRRAEQIRIGIDLGGTKIEALTITAAGIELFRRRIPTPNTYEATITAIRDLAGAAEAAVGRTGTIGIGAPGSLCERTGRWRNSNATFCNGRDLPGDIAAAIGRDIRVENDANCFALSEAIDGAGAGYGMVYGLTAGTGLGGGLVVRRQLHRGGSATAGEVGHNQLPWLTAEDYPLAACYCGKQGCAEQYVSGTGIARDYRRATGWDVTSRDLLADADAGVPEAAAALERLFDRFARFLSLIVNIVDPDAIVLGGGLSNIPGICETVARRVPSYTFAQDINVTFLPAKHGDSSGVRGAARLWDLPA